MIDFSYTGTLLNKTTTYLGYNEPYRHQIFCIFVPSNVFNYVTTFHTYQIFSIFVPSNLFNYVKTFHTYCGPNCPKSI